jgi:DNA-binding IclR family transcriptional regulator
VVKRQRQQALSLSTAPHPLGTIIRFGSAESDNQAGKYRLSPKASQAAFRARQKQAP